MEDKRQSERVKVKLRTLQSKKTHRQHLTEGNQKEANVPQKYLYKVLVLKVYLIYLFKEYTCDLSRDLKKEEGPTKSGKDKEPWVQGGAWKNLNSHVFAG